MDKKKVKSKENSIDHIDYPLVAKTHTSMYLMHKYWARKPHNVVSAYIERYSEPGDIVLDSFSGSGVTPIEALKLNRKAIAVDIDPLAVFITRCTAMHIDIDNFKEAFDKIKAAIKPKIDDIYKTRCPKCKTDVIAEAIIWEDSTPKEIRYSCTCKKGRLWKQPSRDDINLINKINNAQIPHWYPNNELIWNTRVNVHKGTKVYELFTKRNLQVLAMILNKIETTIKDKDIKDILKFTFSSALPQASKLVWVIRQRGRTKEQIKKSKPEVGSWSTRGYWVPKEFFEINAWNCFENRFKKIYRGKKETNEIIPDYKEAHTFDELVNGANLLLLNQSSLDMSNIESNSVDYVFTDPPYGDSVPYLELHYMWNSWLGFNVNFEEEIIISDSPVRKKTFDIYEKMLSKAFIETFRVLKPGKWMTVTFHNKYIKIWNAIINAVVLAGFDLEKIVFQPPPRPSPKSLLAPYASAVGDYYIRLRKPKKVKTKAIKNIIEKRYERIIVVTTKKILAERGEPTPFQFILNGIIPALDKSGLLLKGTKNIQDVLKEHIDKEFILVDVPMDGGKKIGQKWWLKDTASIKINLVPLDERVEKAVINVLNRKITASFDDILQEIFIAFPNSLTPDTQNIKSLLKEYATEVEKKKLWRLKSQVVRREKEHTYMIYYLSKLGEKAGYDVWIGKREQAEIYEGKRLGELSLKKLKLSIKIPKDRLERIEAIDVLWLKKGVIVGVFEVENTTTITEAVVRVTNIPYSDKVSKFIVIPEERENLLVTKLKEPGLQEIGIGNWNFIFYRDLTDLYIATKRRKRSITLNDLLSLAKDPKEKTSKQLSLQFE